MSPSASATANSVGAAAAASPWASPATGGRLVTATELRFSEIISALSVALDITTGQPEGHAMRTALLGMRLADAVKLPAPDRTALFYALLLKDVGCSNNAAKITYLFGADDHLVKRATRLVDWSNPAENLKHCWRNLAPSASLGQKLLKLAALAMQGEKGARQISEARCHQGANIARLLQLPEASSQAIYDLDEHWNGRGFPLGRRREEISLLGRICCLAQTVEVFFLAYGLESARDVASQRRGQWFDPQLVDALLSISHQDPIWESLRSPDLVGALAQFEPTDGVLLVDEAGLDRIAEAFAKVVDAKSPWTYQHSTRVAEIAVGMARELGAGEHLVRDLRRAALLHDLGKLSVPNTILDKHGKPTDEEFAVIRRHPEYTEQILRQVSAFDALAEVAGAHHERLDGRGYHLGRCGAELPWAARVLTVADICEALSAQRPYREALPWERIQAIFAKDLDTGVDRECYAALERWHDRAALASRVDAQLREVERLTREL